MGEKHGKRTGEFGLWLTKYLGESDLYRRYTVIYDHGDAGKEGNVAAIKGFYGSQIANVNRLADIDVLVADENGEVLLLIEIEEGNLHPKKLLGDVFAILLCNGLAVRMAGEQVYYQINEKTRLIITGVVSSRGYGRKKIETVIMPRLDDFDVPGDAINPKNIDIIYGEDVEGMIEALKGEVRNIYHKTEH